MESAFEGYLHFPKSSEINDAYFHMDTSHAATETFQTASKMSVYRPPEQKPMAPTLPCESGKRLMYVIAPSKSATACVSGTDNIVLKTLSILLGSGEPSRVYISGATAIYPCSAKRRATS